MNSATVVRLTRMTCDDEPWVRVALVVGDLEMPIKSIDRSVRCDMALVDDLLRFRLAANRLGLPVRFADVHEDLQELLELVGVIDVLD
ncbi:MAG: hypothetical protein L0K86_06370 [Actinomycetia bacterium]|nr:hypothetical protein [Actinomycetes bacterium]